ncbi:MAG: RICIN domain-containing protein, partial [Armatimonadota bacterium]|nr:RICIN domain-containing protein [Armatimonadota bacterium]
VLDPGPYQIVSALATHEVLDVAPSGTSLQTWPFTNSTNQKWTLAYQGDGYYTIAGAVSGKALSVADDSTQPGGKVEIAPARKRIGQQWYLQQNDDGTYTLLTKAGGKTVALDVGGCSINDGTPVGDWKANGLDCQKWSFRAR